MRLRIDLAYDGGAYYGWARQPDLPTVQGEIEDALHTVLRVPAGSQEEPLRLTVAGRTDTGVHAAGQICHLDMSEVTLEACRGHMDLPATQALMNRLNHRLPADIRILDIQEAPAGFNARFSALERTYVYRISDGSMPVDPRLRSFVLSLDDRLDIDLMNQAAAMIPGLHDFGSFSTPNPGGTTIREVKLAYWSRIGERSLVGEGSGVSAENQQAGHFTVPSMESGLLCFTIVADAFAHNMVRSLVKACVVIGRHRKSLDWFAQKLEVPLREGSTGPIEARGLTLEHVAYPPDDQLAVRSEAIRAKRTL
ncbi:tRNA pseudouridine(38-40) synthase TruA [Bifidobacterium aemilianum]|uniref:tRNA pseudouridine synthase A n=2 Tax=Bifidobacterium aemilianum TaxID=2493120 RepID=A0A366K8T6_9BIFI|nr:tRNA pseudouridine(38-40) synthase TruA [Bifidobacterium aemilianum]